MVISADTVRVAQHNLKTMLNEVFEGRVVFDPVQIEPTSDHYGEDKLNMVSTELASILAPLSIHNIPTESYIQKSEYAEWLALKSQAPWEQEVG